MVPPIPQCNYKEAYIHTYTHTHGLEYLGPDNNSAARESAPSIITAAAQ